MAMVKQFDIYIVNLDPVIGSEIRKKRPCVIISPDEMNILNTVIAAPMTTKGIDFPTRISVTFQNKKGQIALDQIRAIDKKRLAYKAGALKAQTCVKILDVLQEMFAYDP